MKVRIKKDTPFDKAGTVMSIKDFRLKYSYICTDDVTDSELFNYLKVFTKPQSLNRVSKWFEIYKPPKGDSIIDGTMVSVIVEGILYQKTYNGYYSKFIIGNELTPSNSIGIITPDKLAEIVNKKKFESSVLYYTDNPNKKL